MITQPKFQVHCTSASIIIGLNGVYAMGTYKKKQLTHA